MAFITDVQLTVAVHDCLAIKQDNPTAKFWATLITAANIQAYQIIVDTLLQRGWSKTIIDQWDRGAEFQRDIGVWKCLTQGSAMSPQQYSNVALSTLDRRSELKTVAVTIGGVWQEAGEIYGQPQTGPGAISFPPNPYNCGPYSDRSNWWNCW